MKSNHRDDVIEGELVNNGGSDVLTVNQTIAMAAIALLSLYSPQGVLADDKTVRQPIVLGRNHDEAMLLKRLQESNRSRSNLVGGDGNKKNKKSKEIERGISKAIQQAKKINTSRTPEDEALFPTRPLKTTREIERAIEEAFEKGEERPVTFGPYGKTGMAATTQLGESKDTRLLLKGQADLGQNSPVHSFATDLKMPLGEDESLSIATKNLAQGRQNLATGKDPYFVGENAAAIKYSTKWIPGMSL